MQTRWICLCWMLALTGPLLMCSESSTPPKTGHDEPASGSLNEKHEEFKQAARRAGKELGVRDEVFGASSQLPDAGAHRR